MTKADLVEQVAEAIGPGITKKDCALVVDGFLSIFSAKRRGHDRPSDFLNFNLCFF